VIPVIVRIVRRVTGETISGYFAFGMLELTSSWIPIGIEFPTGRAFVTLSKVLTGVIRAVATAATPISDRLCGHLRLLQPPEAFGVKLHATPANGWRWTVGGRLVRHARADGRSLTRFVGASASRLRTSRIGASRLGAMRTGASRFGAMGACALRACADRAGALRACARRIWEHRLDRLRAIGLQLADGTRRGGLRAGWHAERETNGDEHGTGHGHCDRG